MRADLSKYSLCLRRAPQAYAYCHHCTCSELKSNSSPAQIAAVRPPARDETMCLLATLSAQLALASAMMLGAASTHAKQHLPELRCTCTSPCVLVRLPEKKNSRECSALRGSRSAMPAAYALAGRHGASSCSDLNTNFSQLPRCVANAHGTVSTGGAVLQVGCLRGAACSSRADVEKSGLSAPY